MLLREITFRRLDCWRYLHIVHIARFDFRLHQIMQDVANLTADNAQESDFFLQNNGLLHCLNVIFGSPKARNLKKSSFGIANHALFFVIIPRRAFF